MFVLIISRSGSLKCYDTQVSITGPSWPSFFKKHGDKLGFTCSIITLYMLSSSSQLSCLLTQGKRKLSLYLQGIMSWRYLVSMDWTCHAKTISVCTHKFCVDVNYLLNIPLIGTYGLFTCISNRFRQNSGTTAIRDTVLIHDLALDVLKLKMFLSTQC